MLAKATVGVSVAADPARFNVAAVSLAAPAARSENVAAVNDAAVMAELKFATTVVLAATPVAPFSGETVVMVGAAAVVKLNV